MTTDHFRSLLDAHMQADPTPDGYPEPQITAYLDAAARAQGFDGWVDAYHLYAKTATHSACPDCAHALSGHFRAHADGRKACMVIGCRCTG